MGKINISLTHISSQAEIHIGASKINPDIFVGFAINKRFIHSLVSVWKAYARITDWQVTIKKITS